MKPCLSRAIGVSARWMWIVVVAACGGRTLPHETGPMHSADSGHDTGSPTGDAGEDAEAAMCGTSAGEVGGLFRQWITTPDTHSHLPNVSYAGYRYGAALPDLSNRRRVRVVDFGAVPGSPDDASDAIAAALQDIASTGGVVEFPEGELRVRRPIAVQSDDTVLLGAGSDKTRLIFEQPLDDAYAENKRNASSRWSWTGGLVWFTPKSRRTFPAGSADVGPGWEEGWTVTESPLPLLQPAVRGDRQIRLTDASRVRAGDRIAIEVDSSEALLAHLAAEGAYADAIDWTTATFLLPPQQPVVHWPVEVADVGPDNTVQLMQPLRFDLRRQWSPRARRLGPTVQESGVVGMSLVMERSEAYVPARDHNREVGWNGVFMENAWDCFVHDVRVENSENAILFTASKNITVEDFTIASRNEDLAAQHHGTVARQSCQDLLFQDFTITAHPTHGVNVEGFSMGNVWSRGTMAHGTWDVHRSMPMENVITELVMHNDGGTGGRADAGPRMGARHAVWNVVVDNDDCTMVGAPQQMPNGVVVGVVGCEPSDPGNSNAVVRHSGLQGATPDPPNLYEAQRALRLCREP